MKFLVDAQLPRRLAAWLAAAGHDAIHTLDLPAGNRTPDAAICALADQEGRVVVTKDEDFVHSFIVEGRPARLLLVSTGNISNADLYALVQTSLPDVARAFAECRYAQLTRDALVIHE